MLSLDTIIFLREVVTGLTINVGDDNFFALANLFEKAKHELKNAEEALTEKPVQSEED